MSKKLVPLLLAIWMIFCLSACGTTETNDEQTSTPKESQTATPQNTDETTSKEQVNNQVSSNTGTKIENNTIQEEKPKDQSKPISSTNQSKHTHKYANATCTTPKKCSCGATKGNALGHKYKNGICSTCKVVDEQKYVEAQIDAADKAFKDYTKYEEALKIIRYALQKFPQNNSLKTKRDYYQSFAPCYLSSMTPYDKTVWFDSLDNDKDIFGEMHTNCIAKHNSAQWAHATYDLSAKYNTFSAIAYPRYYEGDATKGYIKIYVDGECRYSNTNISPNARPFSISLDVTGAMDIKIEYNWDSTFALAEAKVQKTEK